MRPLSNERLRRLAYGAVFSLLLLYALYEGSALIIGPRIVLESPQNGSTVASSSVTVRGVAKRISAITLDDRPISVDESGRFNESLLLLPGYTILSLEARDSFGRSTRQLVELLYQPAP